MSTDPMDSEEDAERLRGQIVRTHAAIARDEDALAGASAARNGRDIPKVEADLRNRRAYLTELLMEQLRLTMGDYDTEDAIT